MGRRGKNKKQSTNAARDYTGSGEEETIPVRRRGRPQKPLKDDIDEEEVEKRLKIEEEESESAKSSVSNKDVKKQSATENCKKRKRASKGKEIPEGYTSRPRGIPISDTKADELKTTRETSPVSSGGTGTIEHNNRLEGTSDRYTDKHIPAMELLRLLNGNSTHGRKNRFSDNDALTPPGFHPNSNTNRTHVTNEFCRIDQNPAEFSTPDEGNEYTVHGDDMKCPWR